MTAALAALTSRRVVLESSIKDAFLAALAGALMFSTPESRAVDSPLELPSGALVRLNRGQANYMLNCGGCHGANGVSNSRLVPDLRDQVGYYLYSTIGREYLVRLPNVAFATMTDEELADVINFTVLNLGGTSAPAHAARFTSTEVARLRKRPLNEVSLIDYRRKLVDQLLEQHHGSAALRTYGADPH